MGHDQIGSKSTIRPWYSASSWVQIAFIASTLSRMRLKRVSGSVPWFRISSMFQPAPTPNRKRPPEIWSSVATSFAVVIGSRSMTRQTPVPTLSRSVAVAAAASPTNGSIVWLYSRGSSPPPGYGVSRLTGMCVCSARKSDSKPRSSADAPERRRGDRVIGEQDREA